MKRKSRKGKLSAEQKLGKGEEARKLKKDKNTCREGKRREGRRLMH